MTLLVKKKAPNFSGIAVTPNKEFLNISLSDYVNKYICLFFYPLNFTFVCPTELIAINNRISSFESLDTQVIGISVDSQYSHLAWLNTDPNDGGISNIQFPLLSDLDKSISKSYGVLHNDDVSLRGTFLIDKSGNVFHQSINDLPIGRNIDEILRLVDSHIFYKKHGEVCPAGWKTGESGMSETQEGVKDYLNSHHENL